MSEWFANGLMGVGVAFMLIGAIGVFRFGDVYLRLHAASKSLTFGFAFLILGAGLATGSWSLFGKAVLAVLFQFLTSPLSAQMIGRAALHRGVEPRQKPDVVM